MADRVAIRAMLKRIGFSTAAATEIIGEQGIDSVSELGILDNEQSENLCKVLRRPGKAAARGSADSRLEVLARAEENLKLAVYYMKHQDRVSRLVHPANIMLTSIRSLVKQRDCKKNHRDPDTPPKMDARDWPKTMESIEEHLRQFWGLNGTPLSYVIRKSLWPTAKGDNPASGYATLDEEMILRAPILGTGTVRGAVNQESNGPFADSYITDRALAWDKLALLFHNHESWTYAKPARKQRNGCWAYKAVFDHYLGPNNVDHLAGKAKRRLVSLTYKGKSRNWTFEKFVTVHTEQHQILQSLEEHGYKGIDARSKVRFLTDGIKSTKHDTIKATILASAEYQGDFDKCVTLYKDYIKQSEMQPELKVAALDTGGAGQDGSGAKIGGTEVTDWYYTKD